MLYQLTIDDFIGRWGYSKQYVRRELAAYKGKHVDVKISSYGGDLDHGLDIRQQFIDHGDVTVYLSGFVASSATVIAMGAKRVVMSKYAMFLVHKCSNFIDAWGSYNADQMQQLIDDLTANKKENDKIDVVLANMYAAKCKKKVSEILDILRAGRWLTAQEALNLGFVDEISDTPDDVKLNFTPDVEAKFNAFGISTLGLKTEDIPQQPLKEDSKGLFKRVIGSIFPTSKNTSQKDSTTDMSEKHNFKAVERVLKLNSITPGADGNVAVTADQLHSVNARIESLESSVAEKDNIIKERDDKISELTTQIEALKKAPADDTLEIEDGGKGDTAFSASAMYDHFKSIL